MECCIFFFCIVSLPLTMGSASICASHPGPAVLLLWSGLPNGFCTPALHCYHNSWGHVEPRPTQFLLLSFFLHTHSLLFSQKHHISSAPARCLRLVYLTRNALLNCSCLTCNFKGRDLVAPSCCWWHCSIVVKLIIYDENLHICIIKSCFSSIYRRQQLTFMCLSFLDLLQVSSIFLNNMLHTVISWLNKI